MAQTPKAPNPPFSWLKARHEVGAFGKPLLIKHFLASSGALQRAAGGPTLAA
jgi:hypothetical protein